MLSAIDVCNLCGDGAVLCMGYTKGTPKYWLETRKGALHPVPERSAERAISSRLVVPSGDALDGTSQTWRGAPREPYDGPESPVFEKPKRRRSGAGIPMKS